MYERKAGGPKSPKSRSDDIRELRVTTPVAILAHRASRALSQDRYSRFAFPPAGSYLPPTRWRSASPSGPLCFVEFRQVIDFVETIGAQDSCRHQYNTDARPVQSQSALSNFRLESCGSETPTRPPSRQIPARGYESPLWRRGLNSRERLFGIGTREHENTRHSLQVFQGLTQ